MPWPEPDTRPVHIVDLPGDKYTRCGLKDPHDLPKVWVKHVAAHIAGHGMTVCPECAKAGWPKAK